MANHRVPLTDIRDVCGRLDAEAATLARELLPMGRKEGPLWVEAPRSRGGLGDSLKVHIEGTKKGKWSFYSAGTYGDMLDLVAFLNGWTKKEAFAWALEHLGLVRDGKPLPPAERPPVRPAPDPAIVAAREAAELERARAGCRGIFLGCEPQLLGTPAGRYLEARGIDLERLVRLGWGLGALRFAPKLWHPFAKKNFPALVALAIFPDGRVASLHRTYLVERNGTWDRMRPSLDGHEGKLLYTKIHGGVVPLWRGSRLAQAGTGEVLRGYAYSDPKAGPDITMAEGLENSLTIVHADVDRRVACPISLPNVLQIQLPAVYTHRIWVRDRDDGNAQAEALLERCLDHLAEEPNECSVVDPPPGVKDFNAALQLNQNNKPPPVNPSNDRHAGG